MTIQAIVEAALKTQVLTVQQEERLFALMRSGHSSRRDLDALDTLLSALRTDRISRQHRFFN
jgi:hypothetical protein